MCSKRKTKIWNRNSQQRKGFQREPATNLARHQTGPPIVTLLLLAPLGLLKSVGKPTQCPLPVVLHQAEATRPRIQVHVANDIHSADVCKCIFQRKASLSLQQNTPPTTSKERPHQQTRTENGDGRGGDGKTGARNANCNLLDLKKAA